MHSQQSNPKEHIYFTRSIIRPSASLLTLIVSFAKYSGVYQCIIMAILWKIIAALLLISIAEAKPFDLQNADESESVTDEKIDGLATLTAEDMPNLYLVIADAAADRSEDAEESSPIQKRSAEEVDDLETAAGTNVLRPLFVYRQQLAYRERVKKGAIRRPGIRPRF